MQTLYIECNMGAAGDMLCGALLDIIDDKASVIERLNNIGFDGVRCSIENSVKCFVRGTKFNVDINCEENYHSRTSISQIFDIIDSFNIDEKTKKDAKAVYSIIADAESNVHGADVADVHLHEVGAKDAIMDVTACAYLINSINPDRIIVSPVTTGFGQVKTAHGVMSVPAPATAYILMGIKTKSGNIESELCTPTGAALIKYYADIIKSNNDMIVHKIGYGMGTKDFEQPNCVRAFIGESEDEIVYELKCNVDDMTGEEMGYCINKLIEKGANDAFVQNIVMKKSRPAMLLTVICTDDKKDYLTELMFKHTTTLGIRQIKCTRKILDREIEEQGTVRIKRSCGYGACKEKIEFDDIAKIADEKDISVFEARKIIDNT